MRSSGCRVVTKTTERARIPHSLLFLLTVRDSCWTNGWRVVWKGRSKTYFVMRLLLKSPLELPTRRFTNSVFEHSVVRRSMSIGCGTCCCVLNSASTVSLGLVPHTSGSHRVELTGTCHALCSSEYTVYSGAAKNDGVHVSPCEVLESQVGDPCQRSVLKRARNLLSCKCWHSQLQFPISL